ncbi:hypothetical protein [Phyllobacterium lublinensis]|uniref:hypothetical protein n=1 Tax=Phyllobacterium lublinensis TaxID=2875708 RepID=UPI001CCEDF21|nr:hypothetical protein [Phyllobacterium sp. 2063]MBZ9654124.1 hypothetical protein [Phyllobacterium sp. 2063]
MITRRTALISIVATGLLATACTSDGANRAPAYSGPTRTIRGYLQGPPFYSLTASSVVFVTAHDATGGNSAPMPKIASTSFALGRNGTFPVGYEIAVPASGPKRIALAVEIRRAGAVIFSNDRGYSQTTGSTLNIPMREAPPRLKLRGRF